MLLLPLQPARV